TANTIGASSTGNESASAISLHSVDLSAGSAVQATATTDPAAFGSVGATGGAVITHLQSNYGDGEVRATVTDSQVGTTIATGVDGSVAAVDGNRIAANATGNDGTTL